MITCFSFTVPIPPSLNKVYPTNQKTGSRHDSKAVKSYKKLIYEFFLLHKCKTFKNEIELWFHFAFPDNRWRYLSNYIKVLEDCLVENKIIEDDHLVNLLVCSRLKIDKENPHVNVIIYGEV